MLWDDDASLPARDADLGIAQERAMREAAGGYGGIRTVEWQEPDGSWARLRTRGGNPVFERDGDGAASGVPTQAQRGFVAQVPGGRAVLFNPYTLAILKTPYTPAAKPYFVESFATAWNVPAGDTTHWYDVVLFDGTTIKVNAKAMPVLQIAADHGFPAIPYLISRHDTSDQYGNAERNATEKRVFAVGRHSVKSWGGGGVVETLTPTTPRTAGKAMTIGPRVDPALNKAWLGQLFFSGGSWGDTGGEWGFSAAEVAMLLTAPYLTKVSSGPSVPMVPPALTDNGPSSGTLSTAITLPAVAWGMSATGGFTEIQNYVGTGDELVDVYWRWSGIFSDTMPGHVDASYARHSYGSSESFTDSYAGVTLTYYAVNNIDYDVRDETTRYDTTTFTYPAGTRYNATGDDALGQGATTLAMSSGLSPGGVPPYRGRASKTSHGQNLYDPLITGRNYTSQEGVFYVRKDSEDLVWGNFIRNKESGPKVVAHANTGYYDGFMGNVCYKGAGIGNGATRRVISSGYRAYYNPFPHLFATQPPAAQAAIADFALAMAASYAGQVFFDDETSSGMGRTNTGSGLDYYRTSHETVNYDDQALTWNTKDYLLYDTANGVFISVEGAFVGANTSATLTVFLRVKTRHHENVQTLDTRTYTYGELLPEVEIDTGRYAIPSPQIRAIFAPLYQEQGSFKGAHYVTALEEGNGASPFHGFNFLLHLRMYGDLPSVVEDNDGRDVFFVPCNLLEMLYAFVFSQEYGVSASGKRYPVTFTARFNALRDSLFTTPFRVAVRNGVAGAWTDALGADFASVSNVSLWRT
jgi:hypothetical protein